MTRRALAWLAVLGPFFFASYGFANWLASRRSDVGAVVFGWEHRIPFLAWTIVPYWSIDLLYAVSILACTTRLELDRHARRLLFIQIVCVTCFIAFPLRFSFPRPPVHGLYGALFATLGSFDKPFNQAPSLHIALLVAIWICLAGHVARRWRWLLHAWMVLLGVSVLTTYQHHFIDLPTGLAAGLIVCSLDVAPVRAARDRARWRIASVYAAGAIGFGAAALMGGTFLWLFWPALALLSVAGNYAFFGAPGFQKRSDGRLAVRSLVLLAPYLAGAWINSRFRRNATPGLVADGVFIGRIPMRRCEFDAIVDLCAELPCRVPSHAFYRSIPVLDLTVPSDDELRAAAAAIEEARRRGRVLVCCALGLSRSAAAVVAWLLTTRRAATFDDATAMVRRARPAIVLRSHHRAALEALA